MLGSQSDVEVAGRRIWATPNCAKEAVAGQFNFRLQTCKDGRGPK